MLFALPTPPKPPRAPLAPFGRRLAQVLSAFWKLGFPAAPPAPGLPADPPAAPPPAGAVTPFFARHVLNAVADAVVEDDDEDDAPDFGVVVVDFEAIAAPPHAAARRPIDTIATPTLRRRRFLKDDARRHVQWRGARSSVCSRVLMTTIVPSRSVVLLL